MNGTNSDSQVHFVSNWQRFKRFLYTDKKTEFSLDISRVNFDDAFIANIEPRLKSALSFMGEVEKGAIANPDENRMVGHYWLRSPEHAPDSAIRDAITSTLTKIEKFTTAVHSGEIKGSTGKNFRSLLVLGIGGSALGPQFVAHALGSKSDQLKPFFIDNTDPDGIARTLSNLSPEETIVLVISKSGSTPETRNGMLEAKAHFTKSKLDFSKHAVAITGEGSQLDKVAVSENWVARFPMWDWVGGRTSELSAVGLLPAALQGLDIRGMLSGARQMDILTREVTPLKNPAALLALAIYSATDGRGSKDMVVLPYRDRLELFSRYLQQLIMESVGKEKDLSGKVVNQGIAVYGNKGSTDQHAYVQQLRDGIPNFFAVFIEVLKDSSPSNVEVEPGVTSSDYLHGLFLGTRKALSDNGRQSITVTIPEVTASTVGMLIALFERFVGIYAHLINVNAYHQPGVEAGKKAAAEILALQKKLSLENDTDVEALAKKLNADPELIYKLLQRDAAVR